MEVILPIRTKITKLSKWSPNQEGTFIVTQVIYGSEYKLSTWEGEELARSVNGKYLKKYRPTMWEAVNIKENSLPQPQASWVTKVQVKKKRKKA